MNTSISVFVGLMGVFGVGSAAVAADCPTAPEDSRTNDDTGHYYEVYAAHAMSWDDARACAVAASHQDVPGHLATLTSSGEDGWVNDWLNELKQPEAPLAGLLPEFWVGGYQPTGNPPNYDGPTNPDEPGLGWLWVNDAEPALPPEPFPGVNTDTVYANWAAAQGEPNNAGGSENHLALGRYAPGGGWNDEDSDLVGNTSGAGIGGYIVEYDVPRTAAGCTGTSCQTIAGQSLSIPIQWIPPGGATINFSAYEFTDTRVCGGTVGLKLFEYLGPEKTLYIPPYLCGEPKFVVIAVDGSALNFPSGTVLIENDPKVVLNDPSYPYVCKDTKGPILPSTGEDPQDQDVVVYQTTNPGNMLENPSTNPSGPPTTDLQFIGAAGEFTNGCGSGKGSGKELSYIVVGMHVDFGAMGATQEGSHDRFVALTRYKLTLLQQSVALAKSTGALKSGVATLMSAALIGAVKTLDRGNPREALWFVQAFLKLVNAAKYSPATDGNNYNGEHLMRGTNAEFTLRVKVIPNAP